MHYADPAVCPDCRTALGQERLVCSTCGLKLTTKAAWELWQTLETADRQLGEARQQSVLVSTAPSASFTQHLPQAPPVLPPPVASRPRLQADTVLLGLGALFILVAGSIFSTLFLGPFGLLLMTGVAGFMASVADRKGLVASTEALLAVMFGLFGLALGIFTGGTGPGGGIVWSGLMAGAAIGATVAWRQKGKDFLMPKLVTALAVVSLSLAVVFLLDDYVAVDFWAGLAGLAVVVAGAAGCWQQRWKPASASLAIVACLYTAVLSLTAMGEYLTYPTPRELLLDGHGWPLIFITTALVVASLSFKHERVTPFAWPLSLLLVLVCLVAPAEALVQYSGGFVLALTALALGVTRPAPFAQPTRAVAAGAFVLASAWLMAQLLPALEGVATLLARYDGRDPLEPLLVADSTPVAVLTAGGLTAASWLAFRAPEASRWLRWRNLTVTVTASLAVSTLIVMAFATPVTMALLALALATALWLVERRALLGALVFCAAAPFLAFGTFEAFVLFFCLSAALAAVMGWRALLLERQAAFALATFYPVVAFFTVGMEYDWPLRTVSLALLLPAMALLGLAFALRGRERCYGLEATAFVLFAWAFAVALSVGLAWGALFATLIGFSTLLWGLLMPQIVARFLGGAALAGAWWLRLGASSVDEIEAYTFPVGAALLLVAVGVLLRAKQLRTLPVMMPALVFLLVPSTALFLLEPVSLRAIILGLGALALLAVGALLKWQAPFVAGSSVLVLIALVELGPYVAEVHRWVLIGLTGLLLFAVGATWEKRVRDGRAALSYVRQLR